VDKGQSKIAVWAKARGGGAAPLRKEAILNRVRRRGLLGVAAAARPADGADAGEALFAASLRAGWEPERGGVRPPGRPRAASPDANRPVRPSPLGLLSNYDALDEEEVWREEDEEDEEDYGYCPHPDVVGEEDTWTATEPAAEEPAAVRTGGGVECGGGNAKDPVLAVVDSVEVSAGAHSPNFGFHGAGPAFGMVSNRNGERWIWC